MMVEEKEGLSGAESLRKTRTFGKVRCHNPTCMERLEPASGQDHVKCPTCGMEYRLVWVRPDLPRIRGPVWDVNRRIADEVFREKQAALSGKTPKGRGK
ncbi:MAG: hypothetical protein GY849_04800 [Deltaproteobacteria bacterium]|nr:hypothetical protein [Deltaproteobacteria bacterium]